MQPTPSTPTPVASAPQGLSEANLERMQRRFGLTYHLRWALTCQDQLGFAGMDVLEVGGSLPRELVLDVLGCRTWTAIEAPEYYEGLTETAHEVLSGITAQAPATFEEVIEGKAPLTHYNMLLGEIEKLPHSLDGRFDRIFSVAAYEHISHFGEALRAMHRALRPGGWVFALASPIWSCPIGHHIPVIKDKKGTEFTFHSSPIPGHGHLLFRPPEMYEYLCRHTDPETADQLVYYIYHSPNINRLFTEDYIRYCEASPFAVKKVFNTGVGTTQPTVQQMLEGMYPGRKQFSNAGVLMCLQRAQEDQGDE